MKNTIENFLKEYKCPMQYKGFFVLTDVILSSIKYLEEIKNSLKTIYWEVGKKHNVPRLCIERNLRTLINVWSKDEKFYSLFNTIPTNAELIITLAHKIPVTDNKYKETGVYEIIFNC
jgi:hypothetical protein